MAPLLLLLTLVLSGCGSGNESVDQPIQTTSTAVQRATTTATTPATTITSTSTVTQADSSTTPEIVDEDHFWSDGVFESDGYACGVDPLAGCDVARPASLERVGVGTSIDPGVEFINLWFDDDVLDEDGQLILDHGVRIVPLTELPPGIEVSGETWLEVTTSAISTLDFSSHQLWGGPIGGYSAYGWRIDDNWAERSESLKLVPQSGFTDIISELVLVSTTEDMTQWVVGLNSSEDCLYRIAYSNSIIGPLLQISIRLAT